MLRTASAQADDTADDARLVDSRASKGMDRDHPRGEREAAQWIVMTSLPRTSCGTIQKRRKAFRLPMSELFGSVSPQSLLLVGSIQIRLRG